MPGNDHDSNLVSAITSGELRAASRLISAIERGDENLNTALRALYQAGGKTPVMGITGPPGAGKSTLVDQLIHRWRKRGERVAVLAVDPSSALSGGAILGDRVRMGRHNTDTGVFIRSMSARGHLGGLSSASGDALIVLDAMGFDRILIETVGVGQSEIDILHHADTVVVAQIPAGGDKVQAMKAGLLEIADVFVINKCDTPGADAMLSALREVVAENLQHHGSGWHIPLIKSQAVLGQGIDELVAHIDAHRDHLRQHPEQYAQRLERRTRKLLVERMSERLRQRHGSQRSPSSMFEAQLQAVLARTIDPGSAAELILGDT